MKNSKGKSKNFQKQMTMKTQVKTYGSSFCCSSKREVYSNTILPQETRKTLNRQPNFTPKTTGKIRTKNPKNQQKERNIKIQAEINGKKKNERNNSKD